MDRAAILVVMGSRIKSIRKKRGMSQKKLADECHFEKASMSRIESGKTNTSILTLEKIAAALQVHITNFLA